ncbi:MAG: fused MFS/spermidine synthase, partial [Deltaproteobacteria bacterium]|nr:fused MFS/spermidine synthase [Deltaproteobacteria bacterium]
AAEGQSATESAGEPLADAPLLAALAFASGLLVFAAEVTGTHLLTLLIGNSAYAFGLMLAVFLSCLSVGAALAEPLERRGGTHALPVALLLTGAALLLTLPVWGQLPRAFVATGHLVSSWAGRELVRAAVAMGALVVPTICMGLTFPLLLRRVAGRRDVAARVGRLTAVNTVGAIIGSLACGYLVLPALGSEWTLRGVALVFAGCGLATLWWQRRPVTGDRPSRAPGLGRAGGLAVAMGGVCLVGALLLPRWDMMLMTNGANVYFDTQPRPDELVFVREDVHGGLTSVARRGDTLTLYTNGKFQGNNGSEVTAQRSFAHFPSLFVQRFDRALVIGLGTGTTLGTIAAYPYQTIDVAEISPSIVEAAGRFFTGPNRNSLADPRVRLTLNDGRNVLLLATHAYDLITIELTSVWFAGAANLYSLEFYRLCKRHLTVGGILQQWVQLHHIHRRELAVVLRTLRRQFDHVALFVSGGQGIVVASGEPLVTSRARVAELGATRSIAATLGSGQSLVGLMDRLLISGAELDRFITDSEAEGGPILSTDENLYLEYATPKGNVMSYGESYHRMVALLASYRTPEPAARHYVP